MANFDPKHCAQCFKRWSHANDSNVYAFGIVGTPFVKIGLSNDVEARLSALRHAIPFELVVLAEAPGTRKLEESLHKKFAYMKCRGEWFTDPDGRILKYFRRVLCR